MTGLYGILAPIFTSLVDIQEPYFYHLFDSCKGTSESSFFSIFSNPLFSFPLCSVSFQLLIGILNYPFFLSFVETGLPFFMLRIPG